MRDRAIKAANAFALVMVAGGLIVSVFVLAPMVVLWAVNTLAEAAGSDLHVAHGVWSYLATWVLLMFMIGAKVPR